MRRLPLTSKRLLKDLADRPLRIFAVSECPSGWSILAREGYAYRGEGNHYEAQFAYITEKGRNYLALDR